MLALFASSIARAQSSDPLDAYNVAWTTPSADSSGSMPLGNGDIGLNVWTEENGDICFYTSKTDAWDENGRLVKIGRVRLSLAPNPFRAGSPFSQTLRLRQGEVEFRGGNNSSSTLVRIWVDAGAPVVHVDIMDDAEINAYIALELWRTSERPLQGGELVGAYGMDGAPHPVITLPDTVIDSRTLTRAPVAQNALIWFHRNASSIWPETMRLQGMESWLAQGQDPLLNRTFGAIMRGGNFEMQSPRRLRSVRPAREQHLRIHVLTSQTATPQAWVQEALDLVQRNDATSEEQARARHVAWWDQFWNRSWIRVPASSQKDLVLAPPMEKNDLPLRIGADSEGQNAFIGALDDVTVYGRALSPEEIAAHAAQKPGPRDDEACLARWNFEAAGDAALASIASAGGVAQKKGDAQFADVDGRKCLRLTGKGWIELANSTALQLERAVTLEARVRPETMLPTGMRIIDKSKAGTANGYLFDTFPGNSLRMIVAGGMASAQQSLPLNRWTHVAAVFDSRTGEQSLYIDGKRVAGGPSQLATLAPDVTLGYTLQRYITACAGRGAFPIKFNGSLFTVDAREPAETFDPDYRRWGGPYWFQNTRLVYWPMLASGDAELMHPLFRMYSGLMPFLKARTQVYFKHAGAFFPETMYFWGSYANSNYGWERTGKPASHVDNTYIRWHYNGTLELLALMIDYYAHTLDEPFARQVLMPTADEILAFWGSHFPREAGGRLQIKPAQALESYQNCVNPAPDIAGLRWVLGRLLEYGPELTTRDRRDRWSQLLKDTPELPRASVNGQQRLSPAETILGGVGNIENPELYSVFPYRLFGVGKAGLEIARATFAARRTRNNRGWHQDDTQAAFLGLADEAKQLVAGRFAQKHPGSRFPAFYGPNYDWIPDQDHGGNGMMALQTMLLQHDGRKIYVMPAWPRDWEVSFRLHAPLKTIIQGDYKGGTLTFTVDPPTRLADIIFPPNLTTRPAP